ncbi:MAG: L-aspartate oxidase [Bacteroidia bacterium]
MNIKHIQTDVLVLGSGIAGLTFALKAAAFFKVVIISKTEAFSGNTIYAQGGIACALDSFDHTENHINDTLKAGAGLCNTEAVEMLVESAKSAIGFLQQKGVPCTQNENAEIALGKEGGHSHNRIVHVHDHTGYSVEQVLLQQVKSNANITIYEHHFALDLLTENHICFGAKILDIKTGEHKIFQANYTALCTGGAGQIYSNTTNAEVSTGDGFALAERAGADLADLEFVQFHPTAFYHPQAKGFLISEALRGFGGRLVNANGEQFMLQIHPLAELAPRDIVARAMVAEMEKTKAKCLYLDATHLNAEALKREFPQIYKRCLETGVDITKQPIPVVPSAHYFCGGVKTNLHAQTNIARLYAFGETACTGVHGANRLASNSLLEGLVFAEKAFQHIFKNFKSVTAFNSHIYYTQKIPYSEIKAEDILPNFAYVRQEIQQVMWSCFGIVRTRSQMFKGYQKLQKLHSIQTIAALQQHNFLIQETNNMWQAALLVAKAALGRRKSVGLHFIADAGKPNKKPEPLIYAHI